MSLKRFLCNLNEDVKATSGECSLPLKFLELKMAIIKNLKFICTFVTIQLGVLNHLVLTFV